jgi:uncharacterized membrane protein
MSKDLNVPESIREGKRAQFAQEAEGRPNKNAVKILALVALTLVAVVAYVFTGTGGGERAASAVGAGDGKLKAVNGEVSLPVSELSGKARFYDYKTESGKTVRFFAMKSSDGVYRAALDACDVCFKAKKGYSQEGEEMVCNNCGMHFHSAKVNEVKGGCNPVGLERKVADDKLNINARELESGASYF